MQNDFTNAYNDLLNELEQQLNELTTLTATQDAQIKRLMTQNEQLQSTLQTLESENKAYLIALQQADKEQTILNNENNRLNSENRIQNELIKQLEKRIKP